MDWNGVKYSIKCKDCQAEYIGETGKESITVPAPYFPMINRLRNNRQNIS